MTNTCVLAWRVLRGVCPAPHRYWHVGSSMVLLGSQGVLEHAMCMNLESLQPDPAAAASHQATQAAVLMPTLGLTEQQQEVIAVGVQLYYDLEHAVHQERQELQVQMAAVEAAAERAATAGHITTSTTSSETDSAPDPSAGSPGGMAVLDDLSARSLQLQKQEALTCRLEMLLHKEYRLRMAAVGWFVGTLSYEQVAKLALKSWPYATRPLFVATEIMQQWKKRQQHSI